MKIKSSSIVEVVLAVSIIAICFGVTSLIFIRAIKVTSSFEDVKKQTEVQSVLWEYLLLEQDEVANIEGVIVEYENSDSKETLETCSFLGTNGRVVWRQQLLNGND